MTKVNIGGMTLDARVDYLPKDTRWSDRKSVAVTVVLPYAEAVTLFADDATWSVTHEYGDESGAESFVEDMSDFALAGPITDNRDGTVTIKMGKYLPDELMATTLHCVPDSHKAATALRNVIETAVQSIEDDAVALSAAALYPCWHDVVGKAVKVGFRFQHEGKLYKVIKAHTLSASWVPGVGTESLYTCIDETHAGTAGDPIPYEGNMVLTAGLCYVQSGAVYRCTRDTGTPVYHALADLVGLYVEVVA